VTLGPSADEVLAEALDYPVSERVLRLAQYVAAVRSAVLCGAVVPVANGNVVSVAAIGPEVVRAGEALRRAGAYRERGTDKDLAALGALLIKQWLPRATGITPAEVKKLRAWTDVVTARVNGGAKLALRLEEPGERDAWTLSPVLVALHDPSTVIDVSDQRAGALLRTSADAVSDLISQEWGRVRLLRPALPEVADVVELEADEVIDVLGRARDFESIGVSLLAPAGLLKSTARSRVKASGTPAGLHAEGLVLTAAVEVSLEDGTVVALSKEEIDLLAAAKTSLVKLGGRWVLLGEDDLGTVQRVVDLAGAGATVTDLLYGDVEVDMEDVGGWVGDALRGDLLNTVAPLDPEDGFVGTLRPYQREGLGWLTWLEETGLGGILADDMGLGKTCQVLARIWADHTGPTLVVCPATVVTNWVREAAQFTPGLRVGVLHGARRGDADALAEVCDIIVTTYGILRGTPELAEIAWHRVILDEAQYIKNPDTTSARSARRLQATHKISLSGTPVENHLGDLWSLMQFSEPGLLGPRERFERAFVSSPADDGSLGVLRGIINPVVLRRSKRDPGVADDLPDKIDTRVDCALTTEQVGLYEATVRELLLSVDELDGIKRKGNVLAALGRLKMICASPSLVVDAERIVGRSGKMAKLGELTSEIVEEGDAVIVFTQFASLLPTMAKYLEDTTGLEVLYFSGATTLPGRQRIIDGFSREDGPQILLISTRAGGVGINLVRANHVIHYDQWWNPAVEDQASDRAWRIGQERTVQVHHMVCPGTLEERIAELVESKREVAKSVTGATDLASLDTAALRELIGLTGATLDAEDML
jgi:superfamily II DNA or RNA helicase